MSIWIDINEQKPPRHDAVFVKGKPYSNRGVLVSLAVMDHRGDFYSAESTFGWIEKFEDADPNTMDELEGITHWCEVPDHIANAVSE